MRTEIFCFYLRNRLIQTSQTGGQWYSDTSPFSIPCSECRGAFEFGSKMDRKVAKTSFNQTEFQIR
jgi:hypothetical protein